MTTSHYFRGSNRKNGFVEQMLKKRNRIEYYNLNFKTNVESNNKREKKEKRLNFFKDYDLYKLNDLKELPKVIYGESIDECIDILNEVEDLEENGLEELDDIEDQGPTVDFDEPIIKKLKTF